MPTDDRFDTTGTDFADFETFAVAMITQITDMLEDTIGLEDVQGLVNLVAHRLARSLSREMQARKGERLDLAEVGGLCCGLKSRIGGRFTVTAHSDQGLELIGTRCPFQDQVKGRESLCLMTSGVFGRIAADNLGHATVTLSEAIARGHDRCVVRIALHDRGAPLPDHRSLFQREYFPEPS